MDEVTIKVRKNGSYEVRGDFKLVDAESNSIQLPHEGVNFLCRCGHSAEKPFCDGAHKSKCWIDTNEDK